MKLRFTTRLSNLLNRNTGWLLATAIVFFGLYNVGFSKENRELIKNTRSAAQSSEQAAKDAKRAAEDTKRILEAQAQAVTDLKADNAKQTDLIICILAIHGESTAISEADEEHCRVIVNEAQHNPAYNPPQNTPQASPSAQADPKDTPVPKPEIPPEPPEAPGVLDRVNDRLNGLLSPVVRLIQGIL